MTAMPVTKGHKALVQFASEYGYATDQRVKVVLCTQPSEPFVNERYHALYNIVNGLSRTQLIHIDKEISQDATAPGFWDMWWTLLKNRGAELGDTYIASEVYGKRLAEEMGGKFMPYDPERSIMDIKATRVRKNIPMYWNHMAPEFARYLTRRVTIFGAESTGKTTLAKRLGDIHRCYFVPEYARPYLENTVNEITVSSMTDIWKGQRALQDAAGMWEPEPFIVQDTDLFSTVGYWEFPHWQDTLGAPPEGLIRDALAHKSDLYLITQSNIPFERDPLRYGGDVREGSDEYWINVCEKYGLNYIVLRGDNPSARFQQATIEMWKNFHEHSATLKDYERKHNG
jgi:NadR type nicotinamide-nucleotide adenylyltransferase